MNWTLLLAIVLSAVPLNAAIVTVFNTADSGPGSLRNAIAQANATLEADTVVFDPGIEGTTIVLTSGQIDVTNSLTIAAPATNRLTVDGNRSSRLFYFAPGLTNQIFNLRISGGNASSERGGAMVNDHSFLTLSNVVIEGNSARRGGAIFNDGIFPGSATLVIQRSTLRNNSSSNIGGCIFNRGVASSATVTIQDSTLSGNTAGLFPGGVIANNGETGGDARVTILNSTLSGNSARTGSVIDNVANTSSPGSAPVTILNTTLKGNSGEGPAINNIGGVVAIGHTILSHGSGQGIYAPSSTFGGTVTNLGYNLSDHSSGSEFATVVTTLALAPLAANGGPTLTHALLSGSPAINAGDPNFVTNLSSLFADQRGEGFHRIRGGRIDIGAFESPFMPTKISLIAQPTPSPYGQEVTFTATVRAVPENEGSPDGVVTFFINGTPVTRTVDSNQQAILKRADLLAGNYAVSAVYTGTNAFLSSTSAPISHLVIPATTTTTIESSSNPSAVGQQVTFVYRVTAEGVASNQINGDLEMTINGTNPFPSALTVVDGVARFATLDFLAGNHVVAATYFGNANLSPSSGTVTQTVFNLSHPTIANFGAIDKTSQRFRQTSLMQQIITVSNITVEPFSAIRINILLSAADKTANTRVYNASGTNSQGNPYLQHNFGVFPGDSVTFTVEYYVPDRVTLPDPTFTIELAQQQNLPLAEGTPQAVRRQMVLAPDNAILLEVLTQAGAIYHVHYSTDMTTWKAAQPAITGTGYAVQWIDNGPPKTESHPVLQSTRYYQVIKAD